MKDNDIVKALQICKSGACAGCPRLGNGKRVLSCHWELMETVFDLVTRQNAEIERLNRIRAELSKEIENLREDSNADRCVCCGDVIPEGRQVCPKCETKNKEKMLW